MAIETIPGTCHDPIERFNGDGSQATYTYSFPKYEADDVFVYVWNDTTKVYDLKTVDTHYTHNSTNSQITFTSGNIPAAPPSTEFENIIILRKTDICNPKADYTPGSPVRAEDLDNNQKQTLYALQERLLGSDIMNPTFEGDLNMNGHLVNNMGTPLVGDDGANKDYVDDKFTGLQYVGESPPSNPTEGDRWYDCDSGRTYIYFTDSDSSQWVEASPPLDSGSGTVNYILPAATTSQLGGVKVGSNLSVTSDGTLSATSTGTGITDGDKGEITVSNSGATWTIDNDAVTAAKIAANAVGASELADNAVDTAAIAANAVDGTKIAMGSDAQGDILYYNGSDYVRLAKGNASQVLKMNSGATAPEWAADATGSGSLADGDKGDITVSNSSAEWRVNSNIIDNANVNSAAAIAATKLAYTATGTGATANRLVDAKLKDVVSVKDFGAVGDGSTNDATAFQNAINAHNAIYVPQGTYLINAELTCTNRNLTIYGEGEKVTILKFSNSGNGLTWSDTGANSDGSGAQYSLIVKNLQFLAQGAHASGSPIAATYTAISGNVDASVTIENCKFQKSGTSNYWGSPVLLRNARHSTIEQCTYVGKFASSNGTLGGFALEGVAYNSEEGSGTGNSRINNCHVAGIYGPAYEISGLTEGVNVNQCMAIDSLTGLNISHTAGGEPYITVTDCHFDTYQNGVYSKRGIQQIIKGCSFYAHGGADDVTGDPPGADHYDDWVGVQFDTAGNNNDHIIANNHFHGHMGRGGNSGSKTAIGIHLKNGTRYIVENNTFQRLQTGIKIASDVKHSQLLTNRYATTEGGATNGVTNTVDCSSGEILETSVTETTGNSGADNVFHIKTHKSGQNAQLELNTKHSTSGGNSFKLSSYADASAGIETSQYSGFAGTEGHIGIYRANGLAGTTTETGGFTKTFNISPQGGMWFSQKYESGNTPVWNPGNGNTTTGMSFEYHLSNGPALFISRATNNTPLYLNTNGAGNIAHFNCNGSLRGAIHVHPSNAPTLTETSDYRIKENIQPITGSLAKINALKPCTFNIKNTDSNRAEGFVAHEVSDIFPSAVNGTKDEMEDIGDVVDVTGATVQTDVTENEKEENGVWTKTGTRPKLQSICRTTLIPYLIQALQEASTEINSLKARITTLEGN